MTESTSDNERSEPAALVERYRDEITQAFEKFDAERRRRRAQWTAFVRKQQKEEKS